MTNTPRAISEAQNVIAHAVGPFTLREALRKAADALADAEARIESQQLVIESLQREIENLEAEIDDFYYRNEEL